MKRHWRHSWIEIDIDAIIHNIKEIKRYIGSQKEIIGVLKGDAYGHGAVEIAKQIILAGVKYLAAATVDEGIELRNHQIEVPILILGYVGESQLSDLVDYDLSYTLYLEKMARELSSYAEKKDKLAKVHLKINTGMNRIGILPEKALDFLKFIQSLKGLKIEGIFTHYALATQKDKTKANRQFKKFNNLIKEIKKLITKPIIIHSANSGATLEMPYAHFDAVRPGRIIYGLYPYPGVEKVIQLHPGIAVKSEIAQINEIKLGERVGYGGIFKPKQKTYIATLPIGITDGILSKRTVNKISVIINGEKKKVVAVCADMCMVDLGPSKSDVSVGDMVTLIGKQGGVEITIDEIAMLSEQTLSGVLCHLSRRLPRVYLKKGKPYLVKNPFEKYVSLN